MNIQQIVSILIDSGIEQNEAIKEVKMLIEHFCNYTALDIAMGRPIDYQKLEIVKEKAIIRAKTKQPIQYIIGSAYFMGSMYKVTPDVLIPRDETELVVTHAIDLIKRNNFKTILDIGTGSGCIACAIAQKTDCEVLSVDISQKAIDVAKYNIENLGLKNVNLIQSDLFNNIYNRNFDLIISNPPYIPIGTELQKEVQYEPKTALFTSENTGTEFYKKIIEQGKSFLNTNGYIVFELGINQSTIVSEYFSQNNFSNIQIKQDFAKIDRIISAQHTN